MNKKVIYTSIFGSEYYLHEPSVKLDGWDFLCFTDNPDYESDTWKVLHTAKIYGGARDSKKPKILPHRYLKDYDIRFDRSRLEWACDCPAFKYRRRHRIKYCKHILEIQERNLKRRNNGLAKQRS